MTLSKTERVLLDRAVKDDDSPFTTFAVSPWSKYVAWWASRRGLTPNQVTLASLAVAVVAAACCATGTRWGYVAGAVLLQASFGLDCADGQLARLTGRFSEFGGWLDAMVDRLKEYAVYAGLALGSARTGDDVWLLAVAALVLQTLRHAVDFSWSVTPASTSAVEQGAVRRAAGQRRRWHWARKVAILPIGERWALISVLTALTTPRIVFVVLLAAGVLAGAYMLLARARRSLGRLPGTPADAEAAAARPAADVGLGAGRPCDRKQAPASGPPLGMGDPAVAARRRVRRGRGSGGAVRGRRGWSHLRISARADMAPLRFGIPPSARDGRGDGVTDDALRRFRAPDRRGHCARKHRRGRVQGHHGDPGRDLRRPRDRSGVDHVEALAARGCPPGRRRGPGMIGLVLAAGAGRRLRPYTDRLPKALVPVDGDKTVLDVILANFAQVGLTDVAVVIGYAADAVVERQRELEQRHGVRLELVKNDRAEDWNNAYSLWCARDLLGEGVVLSNGDTVHPVSVEERLLASQGSPLRIAVDDVKKLALEEMKIELDAGGALARINKALNPSTAAGEYIGVTLIEPAAAEPLTSALEATWRRDPGLYYEDGYQEYVDRGQRIDICPIGEVSWVEVDDTADLERARLIACHY